MSIQCPHCGGDFNLEVKLTVPAIQQEVPQPVVPLAAPQTRQPHFYVHTPAGKLRQALWDAGYQVSARRGTIYNDKRQGDKFRLKLTPSWVDNTDMIDPVVMDFHLHTWFGADLISHERRGVGYVVQLWAS